MAERANPRAKARRVRALGILCRLLPLLHPQSRCLQLKVWKGQQLRPVLVADASSAATRAMVSASVQKGVLRLRDLLEKAPRKAPFWVETLNASFLAFIGMVTAMNEVVYDASGFGVLDLEAETQGSLEALEALMAMRSHIHGNSEPVEVVTGPSSKKPFRFGNGGVQLSSS